MTSGRHRQEVSVVGGRGVVVQAVVQTGLGRPAHSRRHLEPVHVLEVGPKGAVLVRDTDMVVPRARRRDLGLLDGLLGDLVHDRHLPPGVTGQTLRLGVTDDNPTGTPAGIAPMLATAGPLPADEAAFAFEIKWDGVRALVHIGGGRVLVESRRLVDITARYPELWPLTEVVDRRVVLDGEVVAFGDDGRPSFGRLQHRMHITDPRDVRRRMAPYPVAFMAFDLLWLDERSTTGLPYAERRDLLEGLGLDDSCWATPRNHIGNGADLLEATRARGMEGIVAKRLGSVYEPGRRSRAWIKVKSKPRQEVVVGGWLPGSGNRSGRLGALLAGYYEGNELRYAGRVGTGFTERVLDELATTLRPLERATSPFAGSPPAEVLRSARFVEPKLVADVEFSEWTAGGTMRHPSFKGLREDRAPGSVVREPLAEGE